jgi:hypothetical protein
MWAEGSGEVLGASVSEVAWEGSVEVWEEMFRIVCCQEQDYTAHSLCCLCKHSPCNKVPFPFYKVAIHRYIPPLVLVAAGSVALVVVWAWESVGALVAVAAWEV